MALLSMEDLVTTMLQEALLDPPVRNRLLLLCASLISISQNYDVDFWEWIADMASLSA